MSAKNIGAQLTEIEEEIELVDKKIRELKNHKVKLCEKKLQLEKAINHQIAQRNDQAAGDVWRSETFQWSSKLRQNLNVLFKLTDFRDFQLPAINATLSGEDALLVMATGGGKSLCYQLPAAINDGFTLVISPLISLMEDQLIALKKLKIPCAKLSQSSTKEEVNFIQNSMTNPKADLKLLFVTPERLAKSKRFMTKLQKSYELKRLQRLAIDEVHCCSQWGHDFRPDYKFLGILRRQFPDLPILGLTATATERVLNDVKDILCIPAALTFRASFNRANLFYEVRKFSGNATDVYSDLLDLIRTRFKDQSGIVYCFSKKETEELTAFLQSRKVRAECYHADLPSESRSRVHCDWYSDVCRVIVATIAFGMGIDKPDVRFVVHCSVSKSLESYYQESGRAGRDGHPAVCLLYYRFADIFRQSSMVCTEKMGVEMLYAMIKFCHTETTCRRRILSEYFSENWSPEWCQQGCDVCNLKQSNNSSPDIKKRLADVQKRLLSILNRSEQKLTGLKLVDALTKETKMPRETCEKFIVECLLNDFLKQDFHFTPYSIICYLVPGQKTLYFSDNDQSDDRAKKRPKMVTIE